MAKEKNISNAEKVAALRSLQVSVGWGILLGTLKDNQDYLERAILDGIDPITKERLEPKEQDEARNKRGLLIELMQTPEKLIAAIENAEGSEAIDFDPYAKEASELLQDT